MENHIILNHHIYFSSHPIRLEEVVGYVIDDILTAGTRNLFINISIKNVIIASSHDWVFKQPTTDVTIFEKFTIKDNESSQPNQYRSEYIVNSISEKLIYIGTKGTYKKGLSELPLHIRQAVEMEGFGGIMYFVPTQRLKWAQIS